MPSTSRVNGASTAYGTRLPYVPPRRSRTAPAARSRRWSPGRRIRQVVGVQQLLLTELPGLRSPRRSSAPPTGGTGCRTAPPGTAVPASAGRSRPPAPAGRAAAAARTIADRVSGSCTTVRSARAAASSASSRSRSASQRAVVSRPSSSSSVRSRAAARSCRSPLGGAAPLRPPPRPRYGAARPPGRTAPATAPARSP